MSDMEAQFDEVLFEKLAEMLPPVFRRRDIGELTRGMINAQNLKRIARKHPELRQPVRRLGAQVAYEKQEFLNWLRRYYELFSTERIGDTTGSRKVFGSSRSS